MPHLTDPDTAWFIPAIKDERRIPVDGKVVVARTRELGVISRALPASDSMSFSPPFVVTEEELDRMVGTARQALDEVAAEMGLA